MSGLGQVVKPRGGGGSEGAWYYGNGCGQVTIPVVNGDEIIVWGDGTPTVVGPGTLNTVSGNTHIVFCDDTGDLEIDRDGSGEILAHKLTGATIKTDCG